MELKYTADLESAQNSSNECPAPRTRDGSKEGEPAQWQGREEEDSHQQDDGNVKDITSYAATDVARGSSTKCRHKNCQVLTFGIGEGKML